MTWRSRALACVRAAAGVHGLEWRFADDRLGRLTYDEAAHADLVAQTDRFASSRAGLRVEPLGAVFSRRQIERQLGLEGLAGWQFIQGLLDCCQRKTRSLGNFDYRDLSQNLAVIAALIAIAAPALNQAFGLIVMHGGNGHSTAACNFAYR